MTFAARLRTSVKNNNSILVAGIDPVSDQIPNCFKTNNDPLTAIRNFYLPALDILANQVAAIKPNIAFFEALGISGLSLFKELCDTAKAKNILIIADVKRGEIGNTTKAYSQAYLAGDFVDVDAITVNPFLGSNTIEYFLNDCEKYNKGIFVLAKTSNPDSGFIQSLKNEQTKDASTLIAEWIERQAPRFNDQGLSSIGAVVGCTYPQEAKTLRELMPSAIFLVPGYGAQGGSAKDAVAAYTQTAACVVNASRALFSSYQADLNTTEVFTVLAARLEKFNSDLNLAIVSK